jgi:serine/threonine protein kinase
MTGNCGTVQWMAPEVIANTKYAEPADVFSFGVIMWELLTKECPFEGLNQIQVAMCVLNENKRVVVPDWVPLHLQTLIVSCMHPDPEERPTFSNLLLQLEGM